MSALLLAALVSTLVPLDDVPVPQEPVDAPITDGVRCTSYSIEGDLVPTSSELEITATAYLHEGDQPLAGHGIVAVFTMRDGEVAPRPVNLVTDEFGRASITLPVGAVGVRFVAESPPTGDCTAEPDVVAADVVRPVEATDLPTTGASEWLVTAGLAAVGSGIGVLIGRGRAPRRVGVDRR